MEAIMQTKLWKSVCLWLLVGMLLIGVVAVASAMSSPGFRLDWYVNISGAGGGRSSSTLYTTDFTIGQNAVSAASSPNYSAGMGYWAGFPFETYLYLPTIKKNP
jgi:hypothetical protein